MGLESVELVMEVEDRFGITIRDAEAQEIRTVGQLAALIQRRIDATSRQRCPSFDAFLQTRRLVRELLTQPQLRLRPSMAIAAVVPASQRGDLWRELSSIHGSHPPSLRRPAPLRAMLLAASLIVFALGAMTLFDPRFSLFGIPLAIATIWGLYRATASFCVEPPPRFRTFGHMTQFIVGLTMSTKPLQDISEVLPKLREIVVDILGVDPQDVVPEARFVEDLGMS